MSPRIAVVATAAVLLNALANISATTASSRAPATETRPAVQFVGHDSKVTAPRFVLIKDDKAWGVLWAEHTGTKAASTPPARHAAPRIDFTRFMVVSAFAGAMTNTDGEDAQIVISSDVAVSVRFVASTFQTSSSLEGKADQGVKTVPVGLWVIDRTDTLMVIEEGRRDRKDALLLWKEVKRFDAKEDSGERRLLVNHEPPEFPPRLR